MSSLSRLYKTLFETQENKWKTGIVGMIIITILLAGVFNFEANAIEVVDEATLKELTSNLGTVTDREIQELSILGSESGTTAENSNTDLTIDIDKEKLLEISCTLHWTDEPSQYFQGTNEPDEFKVSIISPKHETVEESELSTSGTVTATASLPDYEEAEFIDNYIGDWIIRIEAGNCGDDSARVPLLGIRLTEDLGNDWTLDYSYRYNDYVETETSE